MNELPSHDPRRTYCNPLVLPDYPRGRSSIGKKPGTFGFLQDPPRDYRETADPSVLYHSGRWYLYPSCGMAYVSDDFVTWRQVRIEPYDCGYAPTVVAHRGRFLLTACGAPILQSADPLGPFTPVGPLRRPSGELVEGFNDPMLFADDDGRLYAYWGLGKPGIFGAEVDPENPDRLFTEPRILFAYDPAHVWERYGPNNEDASKSFVEGPWMVKLGRRYFLTYAAPGTEWRTYGMGTYVAEAPLGPFRYQDRNPILRQTAGLVRGPGHGCIVKGPRDTLWAFYTCTVCYEHLFERRIGMDPAGIDADGNLFVRPASETPQWAPGIVEHPETGNAAGWHCVTASRRCHASSHAPGRNPLYAVDDSMLTWWEPASDDPAPSLEIDVNGTFQVAALRLVWKDVGLDYDAGALPGPFRYRVLTRLGGDAWQVAVDAADNATDLLIDYRVFEPRVASRVRLDILGMPPGIRPGVVSLGVFGVSPC